MAPGTYAHIHIYAPYPVRFPNQIRVQSYQCASVCVSGNHYLARLPFAAQKPRGPIQILPSPLSFSLLPFFMHMSPPPHTHTHLKQTLSLFNPFHLISCPRSFAPANFLIIYISGNISDLRFSSFRLCLAVGFIPIIIKSTRGASLGFRCPFRQPHHSPPRFRRRKLSAGSDGVR